MSLNIPQKRIENLQNFLDKKQNKLIAGNGITINNSDPESPIISCEQESGGTSDYTQLQNKPSINSVVLEGDKTAKDLELFDKNTLISGKNIEISEVLSEGGSEPTGKYQISSLIDQYVLPKASPDTLGGVKIGTGLETTEDGILNNTGYSSNDFTTPLKVKLQGIEEGANNTTIINDLTSGGADSALSAEQGKVLNNTKADLVDGTVPTEQIPTLPYLPTSGGTVNGVIKTETASVGEGTENTGFLSIYPKGKTGTEGLQIRQLLSGNVEIYSEMGGGYNNRLIWDANEKKWKVGSYYIISSSDKAVPNGVASLDSSGKVPTDQIPSLPYLPTSGGTMSGYINMAFGQNIKFLQTGMQIHSNYGNLSQVVISFADTNYPNDGLSISQGNKECYLVKNGVTNKIINESDKGIANGVASLGSDGKVLAEQLPETVLPESYDFVIESYSDADGNWYRVYKSGWVEQGGYAAEVGTELSFTFLKAYANNNYSLTLGMVSTYGQGTSGRYMGCTEKSVTGFKYDNLSGAFPKSFYACGQGAE